HSQGIFICTAFCSRILPSSPAKPPHPFIPFHPSLAPLIMTDSLAERILALDVRAAGRLMRWVDDQHPGARREHDRLFPHTGNAYILGFTGNPGSGKSSLVNRFIRLCRQKDLRVGVVAIDPTSPYSGGAILGHRIWMQEHALDPDVFIRSVATRGNLG